MKQHPFVFIAVSALLLTGGTGCKKLLSAAAEAGAGAASAEPKDAPPKETGTKFTKKGPAVGQKRSEETKTEVNLKLKMLGKDLKLEEVENQKKDEEVLAVDGANITKMKVTYTQDDKTQTENGKAGKTKPTSINGKTYIVSLKDGKVVIQNDKEKPAPAKEAALVEKDYHAFGKPDPMTGAIPDRSLKDGEEVPELAEALKQEMLSNQRTTGKDDKVSIDAAKVTFKGKEGDVGVFDVSMNMKGDAGLFKMSMPLTGKMSLRVADAWPTTLALDGPINLDLSDKDKAAGVEGTGTLKVTSTFTYK
jgi:hypothetical protein